MKKRHNNEFDQFADNYNEILGNGIKVSGVQSDYFSEHKIQIVKNHEKNDNLDFLDFGCGIGNAATFFTKYFPLSKYEGVDISEDSIKIATSKKLKNCTFSNYDGNVLPYKDNSFDIVFTAVVFHHIDFKMHDKLLNEFYRILKKGGRFYIFEHNPWNPITQRIVNTCPFDVDAVLLKPNYTKSIILKTFNNQETHFILFFPRHRIFNTLIKLEKYFSKVPLGGQYFVKAIK